MLFVSMLVGWHRLFNYPSPLFNVELEFACLSREVRLVAIALCCLDSAQPAGLPWL